jgi:Autotransporter beta-domain/IPT/TIG domain
LLAALVSIAATGGAVAQTPILLGISPNSGDGAASVTISGCGFTGVTAVNFGAAAATSATVNSAGPVSIGPSCNVLNLGSITATAPAGSGTVNVTVTNGSGTSNAEQFTYWSPPVVTSISPNSGPPAGNTSVTITGQYFKTNVSFLGVKFGNANAASIIVNSDTSVTATSPPANATLGPTGTVDITVTTNNGNSATSSADQFTYTGTIPTVTQVTPSSGAAAGGTVVTINGTNFTNASAVYFGTTKVTAVLVNSSTSISVTAPSGTGAVDVTVVAPGGTTAVTPADQYTFVPAPTVTAVSPQSGLTAGGNSVTISGTNFTAATAVQFGHTAATSFNVVNANTITATTPAGTGTVDVTVTTAGGTSATNAGDHYVYAQPPIVTSVSPNTGPPGGGINVTIGGANFSGATAVAFGGTAATSFTVNSATSITATVPAGTGIVDVTVTAPGGISTTNPGDHFTYTLAPTVTAVAPNSGPAAGGTNVIITGANFNGVTGVKFGSTAATSFTFNSGTSISATAPAGTGIVDVTVTTGNGTSSTSTADQFTYIPPPTLTALSPNAGLAAGGTTVTITGTGFTAVTSVNFGATAATSFTVNNPNSITAVSPAGTGVVDVTVATASGTTPTSSADKFTYLSASSTPTVTGLTPANGPAAGGTSVTITGTGFTSLTVVHVFFGANSAAPFTINSPTSVTVNSPPGVGIVDVTVTGAAGTSATSAADKFTYNAAIAAAPTVTAVSPNGGPSNSGISVVITGTNFTGATAVNFGANAAPSFTVNSATSITATSPNGTGTVDITVTTPGGTSATSTADHFTYSALPTVTNVSPASGLPGGGSAVTITGVNLSGATAVKFGVTPAASFTVNGPTSITATSPAGTGTVDVTVTTPSGTSATSGADQFSYAGTPTVTSVSPNAGPTTGAISVTITGTNFTGVIAVKFGSTAATAFTVNSVNSIAATAPAGTGTVDVTVTTSSGTSATSPADQFAYGKSTSAVTLTSSLNPTTFGQAVTFTARVTGNSPTGTVTFSDGGTQIGSATLSAGVAAFTIASLSIGSHSITAAYGGDANNAPAAVVLIQIVGVPADSVKLREMQVSTMPIVANLSGQAISGAIDSAVGVGFSGYPESVTPNGSGFTYYFDPDPQPVVKQTGALDQKDLPGVPATLGDHASLTNDFSALGYDAPPPPGPLAVAPQAATSPRPAASPPLPRDWLAWIDVRGADFDRTTSGSDLKGEQENALVGLTRRFSSDFLVGVLAGYEHFDFTSQAYNGVLTGNGFTAGGYLGWRVFSSLRFQAGAAWSDIFAAATSGSATGNFTGQRFLTTAGLTGTYHWQEIAIEPSADIYTLWEKENAYTDSLGTPQASHDFETGRASGGAKFSYPFAFSQMTVTPYVGLYGDYYFSMDSAQAAAQAAALTTVPLIQGFAARSTFGLSSTFAGGANVSAGGEYSGIGNDTHIWTFRLRGSVPF